MLCYIGDLLSFRI